MRKIKLNTITKKLCLAIMMIGLVLNILIICILFPRVYNALEENAIQNVTQICEQSVSYIDHAIDQYEMYKNVIQNDEYLLQLIQDYQSDKSTENQERLSLKLSNYMNTFFDVKSILLILDDQTTFSNVGNRVLAKTVQNSDWFTNYQTNQYSRQFSSLVNSDGKVPEDNKQGGYLFLAYPFQNGSETGDLVFLLPFSVFDKAVKTYVTNDLDFILFGRNNMQIYKYPYDQETSINLDGVKQHLQAPGYYQKQAMSDNDNGIDLISYSRFGGLKLVVHVSHQYMIGKFQSTFYLICFFQLFTVFVLQLSVLILLTKRLKPLHKITKQINRATEENLNIQIDVRSGDELQELASSFNKLMVRIQKYLAEQIELNNQQRQMEYSLFVAQIDPHFIYKALNVITHLAKNNQNEALIEVNQSLITILKNRLRISPIDVMDTIQKEIELVESYLTIQRARYGDCIQFEKEIDESTRDQVIPKNIIQTFIENALFHGILLNLDASESTIVGGTIHLKIKEHAQWIKIQITDNGQGMTNDVIAKYFIEDFHASPEPNPDKGMHIGIRNIRERLSYLYGSDFSLRAISSVGIGTKIVLFLPKKR